MKSSLLFSILIPAYKAKYLKECINSVLSQSYELFELIIVDDNSPENLSSIVKQYSDNRIHYYRNNVGFGAYNVVGNWNKCLEYAIGDYVICIGDDDKLMPCCLDEYKKIIEKYPEKKVYHGWTEIIDENSNFMEITSVRPETESVYSMIWHRWMGRQQFIGDFCFDRIALLKNGGFYMLPLAWGSDDITAVIAATNYGIANTTQLVFQYRKNRFSISTGDNVNIRDKIYSLCLEELWFSDFLKNEPNNYEDRLFKESLVNMISDHYKKRKKGYLTKDMTCHLSSFFYWNKKKKDYGFTIGDLIMALLLGVWTIIKNKINGYD